MDPHFLKGDFGAVSAKFLDQTLDKKLMSHLKVRGVAKPCVAMVYLCGCGYVVEVDGVPVCVGGRLLRVSMSVRRISIKLGRSEIGTLESNGPLLVLPR